MAFPGDRKDLLDYSKRPDSSMGRARIDKFNGSDFNSGVGGPASKTSGGPKGKQTMARNTKISKTNGDRI